MKIFNPYKTHLIKETADVGVFFILRTIQIFLHKVLDITLYHQFSSNLFWVCCNKLIIKATRIVSDASYNNEYYRAFIQAKKHEN